MIAGAGPIGCLMVLAARAKGAGQITVTDLVDEPLAVAKACGADEVVNVRNEPERLDRYKAGKGHFDVGVEATGAVPALANLFDVVRAGRRHRPGRHAAAGRGAGAGQQADGA